MDVLKNIFGGGNPDNYEQRAQQYQQGYQGGQGQYAQMDPNEVAERYQRTVQYAPPEVVQQAHEEVFQNLPPEQRQQIVDQFRRAHDDPNQAFQYPGFNASPQQGYQQQPGYPTQQGYPQQEYQQQYSPQEMGQMVRQAQQQQPDLLQQALGPGGALSSPMAKIAMAGVAAIAAQKMMGQQQGGGQGGGLLGNILGNR